MKFMIISERKAFSGIKNPGIRWVVIFLLLSLFSSFPVQALDPSKSITQYIHESWHSENGLPHESITAIVKTRDGYIWLGTGGGLVRFDGVHFAVFDKMNTPEIKNNEITTLFEDSDGGLWIGTGGGGLLHMKNGKFFLFTTRDGLVHDYVMSVYGDSDGYMWVGTEGGLSCFKDGKFRSYTLKDGLPSENVRAVFVDSKGRVWLGTYGGGLCMLKNEKIIIYTSKKGLSNDFVLSIYEDQEGNLWFGTVKGLNRFKDGKFTTYTKREGLSHDAVRTIYEDREGSLWIGTYGGGLNRFKDGKFTSFTTREGLSHDAVRTIYGDREGSLWIGTYGGGLNRLKDGKLTTFTVKEGLSADYVMSIYEDRKSNLWIGTGGGGLNLLKNGKFTWYTTKEGLSRDVVMSIYEDRKGNLWIGTGGGGLNRFRDGKFRTYTVKDGLSHDFIRAIYESRDGSLWIGTHGGGLSRLKNGRFTSFTTKEGLSNDLVMSIYEDRKGDLWIGTGGGGLNRFRDGKFRTYTVKDGLSHDFIRAIYESGDGSLWIGTHGGGLSRFKDGRFTTYTMKNGLYDDAIYQILEDGKGNLWMGCSKGIFRVKLKDLSDFAEGKIESITSVSYDKSDGMRSSECSSGIQPAACRTRDGKLWFPTLKGVVMIDPENITLNQSPPPVVMEKVIIDDESIDTHRKVRLSPGKKNFTFYYTALSFLVPQRVKFKYRLEGFDKQWIDAGTRRTAYYTNIPPGDYKFQVIACNNDGVWNKKGAAFGFYLSPYFYQTWWFYVLCTVGAVLLGVGIVWLRLRQLKKHKAELEKKVKERTIELSAANKELQQEIAERKRVEKEIRQLKELNEGIVQNMCEGIVVENTDGVMTFVNPATANLLGYSSEEIIGKHWKTIIPSDQHSIIEEAGELCERGEASRYEVEMLGKDGRRIPVLMSGAPCFENKSFTGTIAVFADITERKKAEDALRESERKYRALFNRIADPVFIFDKKTYEFLDCNQAVHRVYGYSMDELKTMTPFDLHLPEEIKLVKQNIDVKNIDRAFSYHHLTRDGRLMAVEIHSDEINYQGRPAWISIVRDITEHKILEDQLRDFAYVVSHDLKAPLRAINQLATWISEDYENAFDEEGKEKLSLLMNRVRRMDNLIDGILKYSRAGRVKGKEEEVDLNNVVKEMVETIAPPDNIQIKIMNRLPVILADPVQIGQVFQNLVGNAIKYMDKSEGKVKIRWADMGSHWKFSVTDNGPGIDEKYYDKIFQIFQTLQSRDRCESTGIGLAVVKKIVEQFGGKIWVKSEVGRGSTFFFTIKKRGKQHEE